MCAVTNSNLNEIHINKNNSIGKTELTSQTTINNINSLENNNINNLNNIVKNDDNLELLNFDTLVNNDFNNSTNQINNKDGNNFQTNQSVVIGITPSGKEIEMELCSASDFSVDKILPKALEESNDQSKIEKVQDYLSNILKKLDINTKEEKAYKNFLYKYKVYIPVEQIKKVKNKGDETYVYLENDSIIVLDSNGTIKSITIREGKYVFNEDGSIYFIKFTDTQKKGISLLFDKDGNIVSGTYTDEEGNIEPISIFSNYNRLAEQYGGDQGSFSRTVEELLEDPIVLEKLRKTFPNATMEDYEKYLKRINQVGCGYTAMINTLFEYYKGRENEFYRKFGFHMYDIESNGFLDYNYEYLILDFFNYIWGNSGYSIQQLYGDIGKKVYDAALDKYEKNPDAKAKGTGTKEKLLFMDFLNKKYGINCNVEFIYENNEQKIIELYKKISKDKNTQIIISANQFELYDRYGNLTDENVGNHAMSVTGVTEDGKLIVSSWGTERILDLSDVDDSYTYITIVRYE